jgi:endoglucanase
MISCNVAEERLTLAKFMDRLGMTDYPDARTIDRPKTYDHTKIFNVKNERNVNSGVNLGSSVQVPYGVDRRRRIEEHDFDAIRDAGFYYVRIPVHFMANLWVASDTQQEDQNQFDYLDWVVDNILKRDMIVILAYFSLISDGQFSFDSEDARIENEEKFFTFWKIISERYKEYPAELYFELANEPHDPITADIWNDYINRVIPQIRNSGGNNKTRMIVVPANILIKKNVHIGFISHSWDVINGIKELELPSVEEDPYVMVTFHYYKPGEFTFQGESYTEDLARFARKRLGNMWDNTDRQKKLIRDDFDIISQWAQENRRKIILGEFGVTIYADMDSQVNWTTFVREEAESRGMIWLFWGFYDFGSFGALYNQSNRYWNENILNALIPLKKSTVGKRDQASVQELIAFLKDPEWKIRENAAIALMSRGPEAEPAIPALIEALRDEEW